MIKSFEEIKAQGGLNFQEFESKRVEAMARNKKGLMLGGIAGGAVALIGIILMVVGNAGLGIFLIFIGLIVFGVWFAIVNSKVKKELKTKILGDLAKGIDPSFSYSMGNKEFMTEFRRSGFVKATSGTTVDDVFLGQYNGMNFGFGEVKVVRKSGSGNNSSTVTVYQGPFAYVETSQNYPYTSIIPDTMEKLLGGVGRLLQKADITRLNQKLLKIEEDQEFEKYYAVWSKDEGVTKGILNPEFRNYLTGLATLHKTYIGWRDNKIYFGMDNRRDLFNIKLKNVINESIVRKFYEDFAGYYNILENVISYVTTGTGAGSHSAQPNADMSDAPPPTDVPPPNSEYYRENKNEA